MIKKVIMLGSLEPIREMSIDISTPNDFIFYADLIKGGYALNDTENNRILLEKEFFNLRKKLQETNDKQNFKG